MYVSAINFCATEILTNFKKKTKSNQYLGMKVNLIFIFKNIEKKNFFDFQFHFFFVLLIVKGNFLRKNRPN